MNLMNIPEGKVLNWYEEEGNVVIDNGREKLIINETGKIVWELINGVNSIKDIIDYMIKKYGDKNPLEYITEIVEESLQLFSNEGLIIIKTGSEFDGWMQYE